jgi:hypothetical protein
MEIVSLKSDGTVVVEMSAKEAAEVRADLGAIPFTKVTPSGNKLHSFLEWAKPQTGSRSAVGRLQGSEFHRGIR